MIHFIEDKKFLGMMRRECSDIVNRLVQNINKDNYLKVEMQMVGSGGRNLETQNSNQPVDLDYNINILHINGDINDCKKIKEYVRKQFNIALKSKGWGDCKDSTSALMTEQRQFKEGNPTSFSIDVAIICESNDSWYRLIHQKTGIFQEDNWIWNEGQDSKGLTKKVNKIKKYNLWNDVRNAYLDKKNMYLKRRDYNHSSFNCYIEVVNEVYNKYFTK